MHTAATAFPQTWCRCKVWTSTPKKSVDWKSGCYFGPEELLVKHQGTKYVGLEAGEMQTPFFCSGAAILNRETRTFDCWLKNIFHIFLHNHLTSKPLETWAGLTKVPGWQWPNTGSGTSIVYGNALRFLLSSGFHRDDWLIVIMPVPVVRSIFGFC